MFVLLGDILWRMQFPRELTAHIITAYVLLIYTNRRVTGIVRCYCNDALCVNTGYMCKSTIGVCFSLSTSDVAGTAQGCAESLPAGVGSACMTDVAPDAHRRREFKQLTCCREDLCNYGDENASRPPTDAIRLLSGASSLHDVTADVRTNWGSVRSDDLWFRAAVIAVPIAGLIALVLFVLLAVRMLRNDFRESDSRTRRATCLDNVKSGKKNKKSSAQRDHLVGDRTAENEVGTLRYEKMISSVSDGDLFCSKQLVTSHQFHCLLDDDRLETNDRSALHEDARSSLV